MTAIPEYKCSLCGIVRHRNNLIVKRTQFLQMGKNGSVIRSRVTGWLCNVPIDGGKSCLEMDADWQRPLWHTSPGMTNLPSNQSEVQNA